MTAPETPTRSLRPEPADLVDVAFAAVLACLGVIGFDSSFGGNEAYVVGLPAVVVGCLAGYVIAKLRMPLLVGAVIGVLAFFLLGGAVALRSDAIAGFIPNPAVAEGLVDGTINGWIRLLTTVPPAGQAGNLLAIPYLAGYGGGVLGVVSAAHFRRVPVCVLPASAVLVTSILFGVDEPASLLLQGAAFGAATIAWLSVRLRRDEPRVGAYAGRSKVIGAVAMLGVAGVGALGVGPRLPGADANDRYVLRDQIDPPFDPSQYPSPLARYRDFDGPEERQIDETLFSVDGLPQGSRVRFAVMDSYDGLVWRASPPNTSTGGTYQRVGDRIGGAPDGERITATFTMGAIAEEESVWIPTAGAPTSIEFLGERSEELTEAFRFNRTTNTAASPTALEEGDQWRVELVLPTEQDPEHLAELGTDDGAAAFAPPGVTPELIEVINTRMVGDARSPYARVQAISEYLQVEGAYNNGEFRPVNAGHGLYRLLEFVVDEQPEGNGEQYAAALAYLAEAIGIPARVVLQFEVRSDGPVDVVADDVEAVVEIALDGVGWVPVAPPTPSEANEPEPEAQQLEEQVPDRVPPPPPTTAPPPNTLPTPPEPEADRDEDTSTSDEGDGILGVLLRLVTVAAVPSIVIFGPALVVVALKARRRSRRRSTGTPAQQVAAGWLEVTDLARDLGRPVPARATRKEAGRFLGVDAAAALADRIDVSVFGHDEPAPGDAASTWQTVDEVRKVMVEGRSLTDRIRAAVSLTSLRAGT